MLAKRDRADTPVEGVNVSRRSLTDQRYLKFALIHWQRVLEQLSQFHKNKTLLMRVSLGTVSPSQPAFYLPFKLGLPRAN